MMVRRIPPVPRRVSSLSGSKGVSKPFIIAVITIAAVLILSLLIMFSDKLVGEAGERAFKQEKPIEVVEGCGDFKWDFNAGEGCDDGNKIKGDGCSPICQVEKNWKCEAPCIIKQGDACLGYGASVCAECGDGNIDKGEMCDDSNTNDNDGCSSGCVIESYDLQNCLDGLRSYWPFDGHVKDVKTNQFGIGNKIQFTDVGGVNSKILFNPNIINYVNVDSNGPIHNEESYTFMALIRGDQQNDNGIYSEGSSTDKDPVFIIRTGHNNKKLAIFIRDDNGKNELSIESNSEVFDSKVHRVHHIAYVENKGNYTLYIDGEKDISGNYIKSKKTLNKATFGAVGRKDYSSLFEGGVDEAGIYTRALTAKEIKGIYEAAWIKKDGIYRGMCSLSIEESKQINCGDGNSDPGEVCDDGNQNNNDECLNTCKKAKCGDGITWEENDTEECDDGNDDNTDSCVFDEMAGYMCKSALCGDGYVQKDVEECDDENKDNNDACTNLCKKAVCGDTYVGPGEQCDDGNKDDNDGCKNNCINNVCGDGIINQGVEQCDDGNFIDDDICSNACKSKVVIVDSDNDGVADNLEPEKCKSNKEGDKGLVYKTGASAGCFYGDLDNTGCVSLIEYNPFKAKYKNNDGGIQSEITLLEYNPYKAKFKNGLIPNCS